MAYWNSLSLCCNVAMCTTGEALRMPRMPRMCISVNQTMYMYIYILYGLYMDYMEYMEYMEYNICNYVYISYMYTFLGYTPSHI